ncbi:MAG: hybrid sensor histidine kinase/response regulator [Cytophagaceae bacterium]|nr:hybrid sensor histidine kinase/response regulator [Cytophagaceae bacterium]
MESSEEIKILLVDDRADNLFSIEQVLSRDNYAITKAQSGKEALKILLKEYDFTLILMDVQMPGLNGIETASMIYEREKLRHIPIIFITANDYSDEFIFKGYKTGGVDYIYKPINPDLLRAKVAVFVDLYRKTHLLMAHEQKLQKVNVELEERVKKRTEELLKKNAELELINSQLKRVNNDLDSFVYTASHDLRAPVSNIEGLLYTLIDSLGEGSKNDESVKTILEMIHMSITKFKTTIQDLTDITKIQKNLETEIESIDICEVLDDVRVNLRELITKSEAELKLDIDSCPRIVFSRKNLNSVLYNLLSNAIKYKSPKRKPVIKIKGYLDEPYVVLSITDNGLGFNPDDKNKIFTMFKRLHDHVEGSGVGLYIVKRIIENCGGKIEVDSTPDKGSTFKVYFKANPAHELNQPIQIGAAT